MKQVGLQKQSVVYKKGPSVLNSIQGDRFIEKVKFGHLTVVRLSRSLRKKLPRHAAWQEQTKSSSLENPYLMLEKQEG